MSCATEWEDMVGLVRVEFGWEEARVVRVVHRPQQLGLAKTLAKRLLAALLLSRTRLEQAVWGV